MHPEDGALEFRDTIRGRAIKRIRLREKEREREKGRDRDRNRDGEGARDRVEKSERKGRVVSESRAPKTTPEN